MSAKKTDVLKFGWSGFLAEVLLAQGKILNWIFEGLGEEGAFRLLEHWMDEKAYTNQSIIDWSQYLSPPPLQEMKVSPHSQLQAAVTHSNIPHSLEFFLWSFPCYRELVELSIPLEARFKSLESSQMKQEFKGHIEAFIQRCKIFSTELAKTHPAMNTLLPFSESTWTQAYSKILNQLGIPIIESLQK